MKDMQEAGRSSIIGSIPELAWENLLINQSEAKQWLMVKAATKVFEDDVLSDTSSIIVESKKSFNKRMNSVADKAKKDVLAEVQ